MKIIYDLAKNGLAKLNLPLELNFPCIVLCQIIMVLWFSMYHVHENVVVVGIDLSGFSMYYLLKKSDLLLALKMLWWWFARNRQQARGTLPPCLHCQTATGKQHPRVGSPPGYRREWRIKKNSRWRVPVTGYASLRCQSRPYRSYI